MSSKNYYEKGLRHVRRISGRSSLSLFCPGMGHCLAWVPKMAPSPPAHPPLLQGTQATTLDSGSEVVRAVTITVNDHDGREVGSCHVSQELRYVSGDVNAAASFTCSVMFAR